MKKLKLEVIDLFCGIGGLSHGFYKQGFKIVAGVDFIESCRFAFEYNNKSEYIKSDIRDIEGGQLKNKYGSDSIKVLAGCAPCQPFSNLNINKGIYLDQDKANERSPLDKYASLIEEIQPDIITMENVRGLANQNKYPSFTHFLDVLKRNNYYFSYKIVDCRKYGIPQNRFRLVLLASKFGEISLIPYTHETNYVTVRDTISHLPVISSGETSKSDPYHRSTLLSDLNMKRIKSMPKNGGNLISGDSTLISPCHIKESGKTYLNSIYARMRWDQPSPTMTTQCIGIGNGRFGHPEQNRGISLREAALFQTFPLDFKFVANESEITNTKIAKQIGNAVPVKLGEVIAISIKNHLKKYL